MNEPLYVFAVGNDLTAILTDEVNTLAKGLRIDLEKVIKRFFVPIDWPAAHMCYMPD